MISNRPIMLILGSGGAHIGVLEALEEAGLTPSYIVGTSVGSLVGGMKAIGKTASQIDTIYRDFLTRQIWYLLADFISDQYAYSQSYFSYLQGITEYKHFNETPIPLAIIGTLDRTVYGTNEYDGEPREPIVYSAIHPYHSYMPGLAEAMKVSTYFWTGVENPNYPGNPEWTGIGPRPIDICTFPYNGGTITSSVYVSDGGNCRFGDNFPIDLSCQAFSSTLNPNDLNIIISDCWGEYGNLNTLIAPNILYLRHHITTPIYDITINNYETIKEDAHQKTSYALNRVDLYKTTTSTYYSIPFNKNWF